MASLHGVTIDAVAAGLPNEVPAICLDTSDSVPISL